MAHVIPSVDSTTKLFPKPTMDALAAALAGSLGRPVHKIVTVRADGTGDFLTPSAANDSLVGAGFGVRYLLDVGPGVYRDPYDWIPKPYVTVRGRDRDRTILIYEVPVDSPDQAIIDRSTITLHDTVTLDSLTVIIDGGRYAVHSEQSGVNRDAVHLSKNCRFIHRGHDAVNAWRTANPSSGLAPRNFNSMTPWGFGSASGLSEIHEDCEFVSPYGPFYGHNQFAFDAPTRNRFVRCRFTTSSTNAAALTINSLGSGTADEYLLQDSDTNALYLLHTDATWFADTYARHLDFEIILDRCSPIGFYDESRGQALTVMSGYETSGVLARVTVTGSAVPVILGDLTYKDGTGDAGFLPFAVGSRDISGITLGFDGRAGMNTLGKRLGNRTGNPLVLQVANRGGHAQAFIFDRDYRTMSNQQIIDTVNAAWAGFVLGSANPVDDYYPRVIGSERLLPNTSAAGITRWSAVAYQDGQVAGRVMRTDDPVSRFAGIALDRMPVGVPGRVLREGVMRRTQLAGLTGTLTPGTTVYHSDTTAGQFALTGTRVFGTARHSDWVYFTAK